MLFDENIELQDKLLQQNSALKSSNASICSSNLNFKHKKSQPTNTMKQAESGAFMDLIDEDEELRFGQAEGIVIELSTLLM